MSNTDAPLAKVPAFGPTEIVSILVTIGGLLTALFGMDWGISAHAEQIVSAGYIIGPFVLGLSRAIKHHGAAHANASVYVAQLAKAAAELAPTPPVNDGTGKHDSAEDVGADLPITDLSGVS